MLLAPGPLLSSGSQVEVQFLLGVHRLFFLKQPFQEGIQADSPWGENSLGFPSQYPRDSITGPIIYCCAAGYSSAQRSIPTTIFISQDLESRLWEGLCWVLLAVCTALTEVTRWYSAGRVMPGALAGADRRLDTAENTHQGGCPCPLKSSGVSTARLLHGGSGSRRPRGSGHSSHRLNLELAYHHVRSPTGGQSSPTPVHVQREDC